MFKKLTANLNLKYDAGQTAQGQTKQTYSPNKPRSHSLCILILWFGPSLPSREKTVPHPPTPDLLARPACFLFPERSLQASSSLSLSTQEAKSGLALHVWLGGQGRQEAQATVWSTRPVHQEYSWPHTAWVICS